MHKLITVFKFLPYILHTIWFNFHYLPIKQAFKLPILLYKPKLLKCSGKIILDFPEIKTGCIILGRNIVSIYPNSGICFENEGTIIFKGTCTIGNNSSLSIGKKGVLEIGDNIVASTTLKLVCYNNILIGNNTRFGWDNLVCDTDFHSVKNINSIKSKGYGPIVIGSNVWIAMKSLILKNTKIPDFCIVGSNSLLNKDYSSIPSRSMIAGSPAKLIKSNVYRDLMDDTIKYY